ncbi:MAG: dihydroorotase [Ignavibacteria bacterium]|jgi:dihydroorotase|nr:dihydroorotase [Ignavibacteria bacterium]MDH7528456.1 dihydroorotase [Ignavibacteria bacterium]
MKVLLKNAFLIDPQVDLNTRGDLLIEDGVISKIDSSIKENVDEIFDLKNLVIVPGFTDVHVHLREPGREDEETVQSGIEAGMNGGFTALCCMPNTEPAIDCAEVVTFVKDRAANSLVDVYPIGAVTKKREGKELALLGEMYEAGVVGFSDDGDPISTSKIMKYALEYSSMFDLPIIEHCEDKSLTESGVMNESINSTKFGLPPHPSLAEVIIALRDIAILRYTGGKLHLAHISAKETVEVLRLAKKEGLNITGEVTPHHFSLTDDAVENYDTNTKVNPPLRTQQDVNALIEALKDGTIDIIASDHAPHSIEEKEWEYIYAPFGMIGLETSIGLTLTKLYHSKILSLQEIIYKMSLNPRKIFKLKEAVIKPGAAANLTILDLEKEWIVDKFSFKSKSINTPFHGWKLKGKSAGVINNSKFFFENKLIDLI